MIDDAMMIGLVGYGACALAFLALAVLLVVSGRHGGQGFLMIAACLATSAWAAAQALQHGVMREESGFAGALDAFSSLLWVGFLASLVQASLRRRLSSPWARAGLAALALLVLVWLATEVLGPWPDEIDFKIHVLAHLVMVVLGLILAESLLRNTPMEDRWRIKFLCIGLGGAFVFDLFFFADALLFA